MPSLDIPKSGLSLGRSHENSSKSDCAVSAVFGLALADGVIEDMIKCFQNKRPIQLCLGSNPTLFYGDNSQSLSSSHDPFPHELYRCNDSSTLSTSSESTAISHTIDTMPPKPFVKEIRVERKFHAGFAATFAPQKFKGISKKPTPSSTSTSNPISKSTAASVPADSDAAVAALQSSFASENAKKQENTTKYIKDGVGLPIPGQRRGAGPLPKAGNKTKFLSQNNRSLASDTTRSMPSSPALTGTGSPSLGPTSVPLSQQRAEQAKATRRPVVHQLVLGPLSEKALHDRLATVSKIDIKQALDKVGELNGSTGKWELRTIFYRELDVWGYNYSSPEERQLAIDNAVRQYDKMRVCVSEPEWERLLQKNERGMGKCLSKLQARIAEGPKARAPKTNVQKADESSRDTPAGDNDLFGEKQAKGESMTRSVSQPPTAKTKKDSEKETSAKRLLSKNTNKPALKPAPARKDKKPVEKPSSKVLSSQFVSDSDEEEDNYLVPEKTTKPAPKPGTKRARDDEVEASDSTTPLSKKAKKDSSTHRISDASQSSRTTTTSTHSSSSSKTKGNSPQKSSPLTSSPTNASEFDNGSGHTSSSSSPYHSINKLKRKSDNTSTDERSSNKRHQKSSSVASSTSSTQSLKPEVLDLARKYKMFYPKYEALHKELALAGEKALNGEKLKNLLDMHERLSKMKKDIKACLAEA